MDKDLHQVQVSIDQEPSGKEDRRCNFQRCYASVYEVLQEVVHGMLESVDVLEFVYCDVQRLFGPKKEKYICLKTNACYKLEVCLMRKIKEKIYLTEKENLILRNLEVKLYVCYMSSMCLMKKNRP